MRRSTWMMVGSRMPYEFDEAKGREVGGAMRLSGRMGLALEARSVVRERVVPGLELWETVGVPRLLVIGPYRMGFELAPLGTWSRLRVFIDYGLPTRRIQRGIGTVLGPSPPTGV